MRYTLPLLLLLLPAGVTVAQDLAQPAPELAAVAGPFSAIASASPPVAVALAMAWAAYQLGQMVTKATAALERILEKGIPIRVEFTEKDREALEALGGRRRVA